MENKQLESIIESLFTIIPMLKKDLMRFELEGEDKDLSPSHLHILFLLEDAGIQSMSEICKHMQINKSNVTPLIQRLIDKKLVQRVSNENDRRYIKAELTSNGRAFLDRLKSMMAADLEKKLGRLELKELQILSSSLINVKNIMTKLI